MAFCIFPYNGLTFIIIMIRSVASIGSATKNTSASVLLIVNAIDDANISITGLLPNGLMPVETEFCILVTSLVRRVTNEDTRKWSILENEYDCSFSYSAFLMLAPSPVLQATGTLHFLFQAQAL